MSAFWQLEDVLEGILAQETDIGDMTLGYLHVNHPVIIAERSGGECEAYLCNSVSIAIPVSMSRGHLVPTSDGQLFAYVAKTITIV